MHQAPVPHQLDHGEGGGAVCIKCEGGRGGAVCINCEGGRLALSLHALPPVDNTSSPAADLDPSPP